jgi:hypothetical protein
MAAAAGVEHLAERADIWTQQTTDRGAIQAEIRRRAHADDFLAAAEPSPTQERLAELEVLPMPHPISIRPWINHTKNLIGRATNWQIHPLVVNANETAVALRDAITLLEERVVQLESERDRP